VIVAVSAPTALALRLAETAGITLIGIARGDEFEIFGRPDRIAVDGSSCSKRKVRMPPEKLAHMANQIGKFFSHQKPEQAVESIASHIRLFWDPRMRRDMLAHCNDPDGRLDPLVRQAVDRLRRPAPSQKSGSGAVYRLRCAWAYAGSEETEPHNNVSRPPVDGKRGTIITVRLGLPPVGTPTHVGISKRPATCPGATCNSGSRCNRGSRLPVHPWVP
jgi:formate dehydrogenase subunit delta